jgi:hypothetical protein
MRDCPLETVAINWHFCPVCGWIYYGCIAPRRNCPKAPANIKARKQQEVQIATAAERLGIKPAHVARYARALLRWTLAGFPVRSDAEVAAIYVEHCEPCEQFIEGRCKKCGCRTVAKGMALTNKIKLATEKCPIGKW